MIEGLIDDSGWMTYEEESPLFGWHIQKSEETSNNSKEKEACMMNAFNQVNCLNYFYLLY